MANKMCHFELFAEDLDQAEKFYGPLFGWQMHPMGDDYRLIQIEGGVGGAFFKQETAVQRVRCYIEVEDIDAKLAEIEAAGGIGMCPKTKISDEHGFFAMFSDTQGNMLGLWSQT